MSLALPLVVQLLGLNVLCFCGHCPASQVLWPAGPDAEVAEHACCHHAEAAEDVEAALPSLAAQSCCGDDHAWRPAAALSSDGQPPLPVVAALILPVPPALSARDRLHTRPIPPQFLARGPPPVPLYLRHLSLQI